MENREILLPGCRQPPTVANVQTPQQEMCHPQLLMLILDRRHLRQGRPSCHFTLGQRGIQYNYWTPPSTQGWSVYIVVGLYNLMAQPLTTAAFFATPAGSKPQFTQTIIPLLHQSGRRSGLSNCGLGILCNLAKLQRVLKWLLDIIIMYKYTQ